MAAWSWEGVCLGCLFPCLWHLLPISSHIASPWVFSLLDTYPFRVVARRQIATGRGLSSIGCVTEFTKVPLANGSHKAKSRISMGGDVTRACIPGGWLIGSTCPGLCFVSGETRVKLTALFFLEDCQSPMR